jgi:PAS domain S-box-containing protein
VTEPSRTYKLAELVAAIVESSDDAIFVAGVDGVIQSWNRGAVALLGHTAEDAVGHGVSMIVRPERQEALKAFLKFIRTGERVRDVESSFVRNDGSLVDVRISVAPLADASGEVVAYVAIFRDLSERNRQEAALRAREVSYQKLVETAHEGIWMVDVEDRSTFVNQHMADLLGYSVEEMLGRSPSDFYFSEAGRLERDQHRKRSLEGIKESREVVYRRREGGGEPARQ